ncbi:MAG: acetamidase/formamidase family protein [Acidobacteriota bacterium]
MIARKILLPGMLFSLVSQLLPAQQTKKYLPEKDDLKYVYAVAAPVLHLKPGDILETWTERADNHYLNKPGDRQPPDALPNPNTGPFYIDGAEVGDTLVVRLLEVEPAEEMAIGEAGPGFGALTATRYTAMLDAPIQDTVWFFRVDRKKRTVEFAANDSDIRIQHPLRPFLGCLAVAPRHGESRQTIVPEFFGGNLDTPEVRAGTTVYFPVNAAGALLYLGDGHALQGEGEIAGTAAEIRMNVRLQVDLIKGRSFHTVRMEDATHLMTAGSYRPLEDAMRIASLEMVRWLAEDYGFSQLDAYEFLSLAMESNVSQLVDPNYTILVKVKKEYLPPRK